MITTRHLDDINEWLDGQTFLVDEGAKGNFTHEKRVIFLYRAEKTDERMNLHLEVRNFSDLSLAGKSLILDQVAIDPQTGEQFTYALPFENNDLLTATLTDVPRGLYGFVIDSVEATV